MPTRDQLADGALSSLVRAIVIMVGKLISQQKISKK
jgi:hypothetical protein